MRRPQIYIAMEMIMSVVLTIVIQATHLFLGLQVCFHDNCLNNKRQTGCCVPCYNLHDDQATVQLLLTMTLQQMNVP